jgi:hypothetical protein
MPPHSSLSSEAICVVERQSAFDDHLQSAPRLLHPLQLLIAAQSRGERSEEFVGGELSLRLVVIDIVVDDNLPLGCLAGLTRAQDDANGLVLELRADEVDQLEAGIVGLHHDVEQDGGDVRNRAHELAALRGRIGRKDLDALAMQAVVVEGEAGALVDGRIVIDDGDLPGQRDLVEGERLVVLDHPDDVMFVGHSSSARVNVVFANSSLGAVSGSLIRKTVPRPDSDSSLSDPPRRRVTRL